jgi:hypothetical protein
VNFGSGSSGTVDTLAGSNGVTAVQVNVNNASGAAVTLTSLTLTDAGGDTSYITSVGVVINGMTEGPPSVFIGNTATLNLNNFVLQSSNQPLLILLSFSGSATGNYQLSISNMEGNSSNNGGQPISITGLPVSGYSVVVQHPTSTATFSPTVTSSPTPTISPTPTSSPTPVPQKYPVIYPNPVDGTSPVYVRPPAFKGGKVSIQIYTLAFRMVLAKPLGQDCEISDIQSHKLVDTWGNLLSSGLYYVVVTTNSGRTIGKMLVLR